MKKSVDFAKVAFDNGILIILIKEPFPCKLLPVGQRVSIKKIKEYEKPSEEEMVDFLTNWWAVNSSTEARESFSKETAEALAKAISKKIGK